ncbi:retrovirus-related pol polyprotein from transposon TNT 1-94 [Tanacetum coccineum]
MTMQEELNQFKTNDVWSLVPPLENQTIIGTKWVFQNKLDENGIVSRNKARIVAQGYNQQERIDFDETYAPVARLESIRILLAYACAYDFKLFQMDVKSAFLNGFINEEVYVAQPPGFVDFGKPNYVFKLKKALYGLKQAPKAWYYRLKAFLLDHLYTMGLVDNTLFNKKRNSHIIIVQIYVDDIIFGSTCQESCDDFSKIMHDEFEMSMIAINLDPIKLLFSTPPNSPQAFLNSLEDLSLATTNPPPPRLSFDTIKCLANKPPPIPPIDSSIHSPTPDMEPPIPPFPPHCSPNLPSNFPPLSPLGPNNLFPMLTHEMFCEHCQRTQAIVDNFQGEVRFILNHFLDRLNVLAHNY